MRLRAAIVPAAFAALAATALPTRAQTAGDVVVEPNIVNPGGTVTVSNAAEQRCDTSKKRDPYAAVYSSGPTPQPDPHNANLRADGSWTVSFVFRPETAPGTYQLTAKCFENDQSVTNYRTYAAVTVTVQVRRPGPPVIDPLRGPPNTSVRINAGNATCPPPQGAASEATVSLIDAGGQVRGVARADVAGNGGWNTALSIPAINPQNVFLRSACRVKNANADYATYAERTFVVQAAPTQASAVTPPPPAPPPSVTTIPATTPGGGPVATTTTIASTTTTTRIEAATYPPSPIAVAVEADPTYVG